MRWAGHVARMAEKGNVNRLLVGKPEGKRPLERPRRWRVGNIKSYLGEKGCFDMDWICLVQGRGKRRAVVNAVMNLRVPQNIGRLSSGCTTGGVSSNAQLHRVSLLLLLLLLFITTFRRL
jgi:hypothetical protein